LVLGFFSHSTASNESTRK